MNLIEKSIVTIDQPLYKENKMKISEVLLTASAMTLLSSIITVPLMAALYYTDVSLTKAIGQASVWFVMIPIVTILITELIKSLVRD